jgi:serine/threonine-protein kinase
MAIQETLGKYEIRRTLGRGAAGVVLEGWDPVIQRRVAIKTVRIDDVSDPDTKESLDRFRREAQAAGRLIHPNIVTIHDYGETDDLAYIVMEFVEGPSLRGVLDLGRTLGTEAAVRLMEDVLAGLGFSHRHGVVHRDIKPSNVMLTTADLENARAKLADFGIARIESSTLTQAGTMMGTPAYMAPKQFLGEAIDARTDLYAAGVLLYQLLTGQRPFEGAISNIMHQVLTNEARPPSAVSVAAPAALDDVVLRAIAKRPADRFQSADAFAEALRGARETGFATEMVDLTVRDVALIEGPSVAARVPTTTPVGVPPRPPVTMNPALAPVAEPRARWLFFAGAALGVIAVGSAATLFLNGPDNLPPAVVTPPPAAIVDATPGPSISAEPVRAPQASLPPVASPPDASPSAGNPPAGALIAAPERPTTPSEPARESAPIPAQPREDTAVATPNPAPERLVAARPLVSAAELRSGLIRALSEQRCALVDGGMNGDVAEMRGAAGPGVEGAFATTLAALGLPARVAWRVDVSDRVFCPTLDALRGVGPLFGVDGPRLELTLAGDRTVLRDGDKIRPRLVMPRFGGHLAVQYLAHDGTVQHLYPQVDDPGQGVKADLDRRFAPSEWINLGDPGPGQPGWEASEPFGRDLLVAIAASRPIFTAPRRRNEQPLSEYLNDLTRAIEALRRAGAEVTATAIVVEVVRR